ncbi:MAG: DegT/DnrJ/EryC1/StrS aminotransferase family protein [Candidatus Diapherotrites archaeon]
MIPVFRPSMGEEEANAVRKVIESGYVICGPRVKEFENKFAEFIGTKYAVATNSGTAALHLALKVLDVDKGEVISTPLTFVSTIHSILYNNSTPVFADIQPDTLNISPDDIRKKMSEKTKAIIPVHYGGHPCEMDELNEIAKENELFVIEDAAHACGAEYRGMMAGNLGEIGCFSFHGVKNLSTGDGGMITTNNKEIAERLQLLSWLGIDKDTFSRDNQNYKWHYDVTELGFKYHMNDLAAAIGLIQLKKLDVANKKRREITKQYNDSFSKLNWLEIPAKRSYVKSSNHNYVIKMNDEKTRDRLIAHLAENGISSSVHYKPIYLHSLYKKMGIAGSTPVAGSVWKRLLTLPLFPDLTDGDMGRVMDCVRKFKP